MKNNEKIASLKKYAIISLVLVIFIMIAFLPKIVAFLQDSLNGKQPQFEKMQSVALEMKDSLSPLGKLALLKNQNSIEVSTEDALMSEEEVRQAVLRELSQYVDSNMMSSYEGIVGECRPLLMWNPENPEISSIVWDCVYGQKSSDFQSLSLLLDDETGKILLIHFATEDKINEFEQVEYMQTFVETYFNAWGIEYEEFEVNLHDKYIGEEASACAYRFGDQVYGEINVVFYIYRNGFYVEFPEYMIEVDAVYENEKVY